MKTPTIILTILIIASILTACNTNEFKNDQFPLEIGEYKYKSSILNNKEKKCLDNNPKACALYRKYDFIDNKNNTVQITPLTIISQDQQYLQYIESISQKHPSNPKIRTINNTLYWQTIETYNLIKIDNTKVTVENSELKTTILTPDLNNIVINWAIENYPPVDFFY